MFNTILVAIDHSPASQQVFEQALFIAQANQANLLLIYVLEVEAADSPLMSSYLLHSQNRSIHFSSKIVHPAHEVFDREWADFKHRGIQLLRSYARKAISNGIQTEYSQIMGHPGSTICEFAYSCYADLIVIGRRGHSGLDQLFLGSVSNYVVHHAPCSILLAQTPIEQQNISQKIPQLTAYN
ncbi:MAG: universal stress protein [Cyanobacteria bacterium P01_G01_bin.39]